MLDSKTTALIRAAHRTLMPDTAVFQRASAPQDTFGQPVDAGAGSTYSVACLYIEKEQRPASDQRGDQKTYQYFLKVPYDAGVLETDHVQSITLSSGTLPATGTFRIKSIKQDRPTGPVLMVMVELEVVK